MIKSIVNNGKEINIEFKRHWYIAATVIVFALSTFFIGSFILQMLKSDMIRQPIVNYLVIGSLFIFYLLINYFSGVKALLDSRDKTITRESGFYYINNKAYPANTLENITAFKTGSHLGSRSNFYFTVKFSGEKPVYLAVRLPEEQAAWLGKELESFFKVKIKIDQRFFGYF